MPYTFVAGVLTEGDYLKNAIGEEYYPIYNEVEIVLNNRYIKLLNGREVYPKNIDHDLVDNFRYAIDENQNQFYPKGPDGAEVILKNIYAKDVYNSEIYPKKNDGYEFTTGQYAVDRNGNPFYPTYITNGIRFPLVIITDIKNPKFIPNNTSVNFINLDQKYTIDNIDYFKTITNNNVGEFFLSIMTSDVDTYNHWKVLNPDLPEPFRKISTKRNRQNLDVYARKNDMFVYKDNEELLVNFDRKNKLHYYILENGIKVYYVKDLYNNTFYYKDINKKLFYDSSDRYLLSNLNGDLIFYRQMVNNTYLEIYNMQRPFIERISNILIQSQDFDCLKHIVCRSSDKRYFWYEKFGIVYFDYIMKKQSKIRYEILPNNEKRYFEHDGLGKITIQPPLEILNQESDIEDSIVPLETLSFFTNKKKKYYMYLPFLFILLLILCISLFPNVKQYFFK